jgi:phosphoglucomutase
LLVAQPEKHREPTGSAELESVCRLLVDRYQARGEGAAGRLREWLSGSVPFAYPEILERTLAPEHIGLLFDCFWQILPFGTGGRRGRVGYGPNRMNPTTVALTIQGHCRYLKGLFADRKDLTVVVANDVRVFRDVAGTYRFLGAEHPLIGVSARSLAKFACEIYAANGITAYLNDPESDSAFLSTPELSFLIGKLGAAGGIVLSASHNPPDDNGVKLYDERGSQPVAPQDQRLLDAMGDNTNILRVPFNEALGKGLVRSIPAELHGAYIDGYKQLFVGFSKPLPAPPIVYTPLCGVGLSTIGDVLKALGFPIKTPPAEGPDGSFSVIPFRSPNPEVPQSTEPARRYAEEVGSDVVLSSDPDADRVGLEARLPDGTWYHFDGNQIAAMLCYALMLDPNGPRRSGLVIETLVTSRLLQRIAELRGASPVIGDLLVGFKYVADVLKGLDTDGQYGGVQAASKDLVLAAEESHGVCMLPSIPEKDATPACMFLAALYQRVQASGRSLLDYYVSILEEVGGYDSVGRSLMMSGAEGVMQRDRIMERLRRAPPERLAGAPVRRIVDHWDEQKFGPFRSESDRLPRNVLEIFTDRFVTIVRPSGTEPKVKFYCHLLPEGAPAGVRGRELLGALRNAADRLAAEIYGDILGFLDITLNAPALLLTDIIDVDKKVAFERDVIPELERRALAGQSSFDELLAWLRERSAPLIPGADPLPALKAPVALIARELGKKAPSTPLIAALAHWASV